MTEERMALVEPPQKSGDLRGLIGGGRHGRTGNRRNETD
jgi:hypothetical protein